VTTVITSFRSPDFTTNGKSIAVVPVDGIREGSLEFAFYREKIEQRLKIAGFSIADSKDAELIAVVSYGIDDGVRHTSNIPIQGQTGGGTTYHSGTVYGAGGSASYSGSSYQMPTYGTVGSFPVSVTEYTRAIAMDIIRPSKQKNSEPKVVYELRAKSKGHCSNFSEVFDEMLDGIFQVFPGENNESITVDVPAVFENC